MPRMAFLQWQEEVLKRSFNQKLPTTRELPRPHYKFVYPTSDLTDIQFQYNRRGRLRLADAKPKGRLISIQL